VACSHVTSKEIEDHSNWYCIRGIIRIAEGCGILWGWTTFKLQALPGIDNIGPDDIVILKYKGDNPAFTEPGSG
jgi:hypothetical protein